MSVTISPQIHLQFFAASGVVAAGYQLFTYQAGTSIKQATWTDSTQSTQNANPLQLDSQGRAYVWPDPTLVYKYVLALPTDTDPPQSPVETVDNVQSPINLSNITQALIGTTLYPRTAAEIAAGVTPTSYAIPSHFSVGGVLAARYGATTSDGTGAANTPAINNAMLVANQLGGGFVVLGAGNYNINAALTGQAHVILAGQGMGMGTALNTNSTSGGTSITQLSASSDVVDFVNMSGCGLRDITVIAGTGGTAAVLWQATGSDQVSYLQLENVAVDLTANNSGVGIWIDNVGASSDLYFPRLRNVTVTGGSGNSYGTKVGIRVGNSASTFSVVYGDFSDILVTNVQIGLDLQFCQSSAFKSVILYNIAGGGGVGIKGTKASYNQFFGLQIEDGTIDVYINWASTSGFNLVQMSGAISGASTKIVDSSPITAPNQYYGDNGSSGFTNQFGPALNLFDVRSLTLGRYLTPAATAWTLYSANTVSITPAGNSIAANSYYDQVVSVTGLVATDNIIVTPQSGINPNLVCACAGVGAGFFRVRVLNVSTSAEAAPNFILNYVILR